MDYKIGYLNKPLSFYLKNKNSKHYKEYVGNSLYYEKIKYYKKIFNKNFMILSFNEFKFYPQITMKAVFQFLKINSIKLDFTKKYNTYGQPRSFLLYYLRKLKIYNTIRLLVPDILKQNVKNILINDNIEKPDLNEEKKILGQIFKNENKNLEELLQRKLW